MKCVQCGSENSDNAKFCRGCGRKLEIEVVAPVPSTSSMVQCSKCGHPNEMGKKFCPKCGASLSAAAPIPATPTQTQSSAAPGPTKSHAAASSQPETVANELPPARGGLSKAVLGGVVAVLLATAAGGGYWYYQKQEAEKAIAAERQREEIERVRAEARARVEAEAAKAEAARAEAARAEAQRAISTAEMEKARAQAQVAQAEASRAAAQAQVARQAQQSKSGVAQGSCKVFLKDDFNNASLLRAYNGGCKAGLADGQGNYTYSVKGSNGERIFRVEGLFRNGHLNGIASISGENSHDQGEYRDDRAWNTISRGTSAGVRYGYEFQNGVRIAYCRDNRLSEQNCTDAARDRLLGTNVNVPAQQSEVGRQGQQSTSGIAQGNEASCSLNSPAGWSLEISGSCTRRTVGNIVEFRVKAINIKYNSLGTANRISTDYVDLTGLQFIVNNPSSRQVLRREVKPILARVEKTGTPVAVGNVDTLVFQIDKEILDRAEHVGFAIIAGSIMFPMLLDGK